MSNLIYQDINNQGMFYSDEKKQTTENDQLAKYSAQLCATPSPSMLSFLTFEKGSSIMSEHSYCHSTSSNYGSINTDQSVATTISPNDDDEGLYLLWTHQLLKERGHEPSPLKRLLKDEDDDDCSSAESSITDLSAEDISVFSKMKVVLRSWFPLC